MMTDSVAPEAQKRSDDLLFAAALEALPAAVVVLWGAVAVLASPSDGLRSITSALGMWFNPQRAFAQPPADLLLSVALLVAYVGPGLGRMYLNDWQGFAHYLWMRGGLLAAAFVGYVAFHPDLLWRYGAHAGDRDALRHDRAGARADLRQLRLGVGPGAPVHVGL